MPELDGYQTARQILKRWPDGARPRIVAMTANALRGDREKCIEAGMDDYLPKPVELAELRKALVRWGSARNPQGVLKAAAEASPGAPATPEMESAPAQPAPSSLIDWGRLDELTGQDPELFREFTELYVTQTLDQLQKMGSAIESGNSEEVSHLAHKCKGSSGTCGITSLTPVFQKLEQLARGGSLAGASNLHLEAKALFDQVQTAIKTHLGA